MLIFYLPTAVPLVPKPRPKGKTVAMPSLVNLGNKATTGLDPKLLDTSFIIVSDSWLFPSKLIADLFFSDDDLKCKSKFSILLNEST